MQYMAEQEMGTNFPVADLQVKLFLTWVEIKILGTNHVKFRNNSSIWS
jgi:hypothetical protein